MTARSLTCRLTEPNDRAEVRLKVFEAASSIVYKNTVVKITATTKAGSKLTTLIGLISSRLMPMGIVRHYTKDSDDDCYNACMFHEKSVAEYAAQMNSEPGWEEKAKRQRLLDRLTAGLTIEMSTGQKITFQLSDQVVDTDRPGPETDDKNSDFRRK